MSYRRGSDQVRHEIVFRATRHPVSCYRIRLTSAASTAQQKTQCEVFDCNFEPVPFDLVPITDDAAEEREYLLFFREPIVPGDARAGNAARAGRRRQPTTDNRQPRSAGRLKPTAPRA